MKKYLVLLFVLSYGFCDDYKLRVGNPDDTAKIERPCITYDVNCIRKFFSTHAKCKPSYGPAPDPLIRPQNNGIYVPMANVTLTLINEVIRGLNGRIDEFYINRDTDKLVIAIEFRNLSKEVNPIYFRFDRRAKEPIVTNSSGNIFYPSVLITSVIPKIDDLQLEQAESVAFVNDAVVPLYISPEAAQSSDPQVQASLSLFVTNMRILLQEVYLVDAEFFSVAFIQYNICDFGLFNF